MRFIIGSLVVLAVGGGILAHHDSGPASKKEGATAPAQSQVAAVAAPPMQAHSWPKAAIDRANEVKSQVQRQRKEDGVR